MRIYRGAEKEESLPSMKRLWKVSWKMSRRMWAKKREKRGSFAMKSGSWVHSKGLKQLLHGAKKENNELWSWKGRQKSRTGKKVGCMEILLLWEGGGSLKGLHSSVGLQALPFLTLDLSSCLKPLWSLFFFFLPKYPWAFLFLCLDL